MCIFFGILTLFLGRYYIFIGSVFPFFICVYLCDDYAVYTHALSMIISFSQFLFAIGF